MRHRPAGVKGATSHPLILRALVVPSLKRNTHSKTIPKHIGWKMHPFVLLTHLFTPHAPVQPMMIFIEFAIHTLESPIHSRGPHPPTHPPA